MGICSVYDILYFKGFTLKFQCFSLTIQFSALKYIHAFLLPDAYLLSNEVLKDLKICLKYQNPASEILHGNLLQEKIEYATSLSTPSYFLLHQTNENS